jgi:uncharacterized protein with von Willebrand factor type A (vWA) domain
MATSSEVKAGLDDIATVIRTQHQVIRKMKYDAAAASSQLDDVPVSFADVINTINGYAADTQDAFEQVSKAELAKLTDEFLALKAQADTVAALAV